MSTKQARITRTLRLSVTKIGEDAFTARINETRDDVDEVVYEVSRATADRARYAALSGFGVLDRDGTLEVAGRAVDVVEVAS